MCHISRIDVSENELNINRKLLLKENFAAVFINRNLSLSRKHISPIDHLLFFYKHANTFHILAEEGLVRYDFLLLFWIMNTSTYVFSSHHWRNNIQTCFSLSFTVKREGSKSPNDESSSKVQLVYSRHTIRFQNDWTRYFRYEKRFNRTDISFVFVKLFILFFWCFLYLQTLRSRHGSWRWTNWFWNLGGTNWCLLTLCTFRISSERKLIWTQYFRDFRQKKNIQSQR